MSTFVPREVQAGLDRARLKAMKSKSRLRIHSGGSVFPVLRMWESGFAMEAEIAPRLRGYVDLYDGSIHLFQCLVVASEEDAGEMRYEFKRLTAVSEAPALDFAKAHDAPLAFLEGKV